MNPAPSHPGPAHILLAEDDGELRDAIAAALRSDGHEVVAARDGGRMLVQVGAAYASAQPREAYDLVISDVRMPVCGGMQILEGLRRAHWRTPVILMSAFVDASTRSHAGSLGALLLDKPFDLDELRATVLELLGRAAAGPVTGVTGR